MERTLCSLCLWPRRARTFRTVRSKLLNLKSSFYKNSRYARKEFRIMEDPNEPGFLSDKSWLSAVFALSILLLPYADTWNGASQPHQVAYYHKLYSPLFVLYISSSQSLSLFLPFSFSLFLSLTHSLCFWLYVFLPFLFLPLSFSFSLFFRSLLPLKFLKFNRAILCCLLLRTDSKTD